MKNRFSFIIDQLFVAFISFIVCFLFFNFFTERAIAFTLSCCLALLLTLFSVYRARGKRIKSLLDKVERELIQKFTEALNFSSRTEQNSLLEKALKNTGVSFERKKGGFFIKGKPLAVFMRFGFDKVGKSDILKIFNSINDGDRAYILSHKFDGEVVAFSDRFDGKIRLVTQEKVYAFFKEQNVLPSNKYANFVEPKKKKARLINLLKKGNSRKFLLFGLTFLFMSYFVPIKLYYIICGCLFLIFSLILRLFGKEEKTVE